MDVNLFDFALPQENIALHPARPRDSARMLVISPDGALEDRAISDLPGFLRSGDALVVNDTRVIPARLKGIRVRGDSIAHIEATLIRREAPNLWRAFVRPAKRLAIGERVRFGSCAENAACLQSTVDADVLERREGEVLFSFHLSGAALDEVIEATGEMPLPPYIAARRETEESDSSGYQTMFAKNSGAVAAPTAGLHFTPDLLAAIKAAGVTIHRVTLHVGAGTFLPVKAEDTDAHVMHSEWGAVSQETAEALNTVRDGGGRIIAVGTTALRILESAADKQRRIAAFSGETAIFITPGYSFRAVDALLTNFHLPRSTLFMLVSAFSGLEVMQAAYAHAISAGYRFYSYGDACFLLGTSSGER